MPKKFAGENSKAVAARQRKENEKQEKEQKMKKMMEDAEWEDNDEKLKKKQQKKVPHVIIGNCGLLVGIERMLKLDNIHFILVVFINIYLLGVLWDEYGKKKNICT